MGRTMGSNAPVGSFLKNEDEPFIDGSGTLTEEQEPVLKGIHREKMDGKCK